MVTLKKANTLISNGKFSRCGSGSVCSGDQLQVFETTSSPLIKSLKFEQVGTRSDGANYIEFKSMEIYGTLIFDNERLNSCFHRRYFCVSLSFILCLVYSY